MAPLVSRRRQGRRPTRLPAPAVVGLCGLWMLASPALNHAQQDSLAGEALYTDRLGCWGCHGQVGEGGEGRPLRNTPLALARFVKELRLPSGIMPPFADFIVSDEELVMVYRWLEGVDRVATPPAITFKLRGFEDVEADTDSEVGFTAKVATEASGKLADGNVTRWRYRVTLLSRDNIPVAHRTFAMRLSEKDDWSEFTTDEGGQAVLGPEEGITGADLLETEDAPATTRLRVALPAGRYVFVVEAIDAEASANPTVVGIGTTVVNVT